MPSPDTDPSPKALENPLSKVPQPIIWVETLELGYEEQSVPSAVCFGCGKEASETPTNLSKCAKCHVAAYCSRDCQVKDWKEGRHKLACPSYCRLQKIQEDNIREQIRNELFGRIRFYACPYAVHKTHELGKGFLFIQSDTALEDASLALPKNRFGRPVPTRSILMHFLTLGEYDAEVCRDDFEMAVVRSNLQKLLEGYDEHNELVILMRLRCGHVALGKATLVPDYRICAKLGRDYYADSPAGAVQLTLDDL
jgi:MYND finger